MRECRSSVVPAVVWSANIASTTEVPAWAYIAELVWSPLFDVSNLVFIGEKVLLVADKGAVSRKHLEARSAAAPVSGVGYRGGYKAYLDS